MKACEVVMDYKSEPLIRKLKKKSDFIRGWSILGDQGGFYHKLLQSV